MDTTTTCDARGDIIATRVIRRVPLSELVNRERERPKASEGEFNSSI